MISFKELRYIIEAKKSKPKSSYVRGPFPDSKQGAINAFHNESDKRLHAKDPKKDYIVSPGERPHMWVLSNKEQNKSYMVYTNSRIADLLPDRGDDHADFEEIAHDKAMRYHANKSR